VKSSKQIVSKFRKNTIFGTIAFITIVIIGVIIFRRLNWLETTALWILSNMGAIIIIWLAYHHMGKLQDELHNQIYISQKKSQRKMAIARLSAGFTNGLSETEICCEIAQRLNEVQGYEFVAVYLLEKDTGNRVLQASIGGLGMPNYHQIPPGKGLSQRPLIDGKLQYTPDVSLDDWLSPV